MVSEGDRVELIHTSDEYTNLEPGDTGRVTGTRMVTVPHPSVSGTTIERQKTWVEWDSGSTLAMIGGVDRLKQIEE
jgi:hypothetical protein